MRWAASGRTATAAGAWTVVAAVFVLAPASPAHAEHAPAPAADDAVRLSRPAALPHPDAEGNAGRAGSADRTDRTDQPSGPSGPSASAQSQGSGSADGSGSGSGHSDDSGHPGRPSPPGPSAPPAGPGPEHPDPSGSSGPSRPSGSAGATHRPGPPDAPAPGPDPGSATGPVLPHITPPPLPTLPLPVVSPPDWRPGGLPHLPPVLTWKPGAGVSAPQAGGGGTAGADQPQATGTVPSGTPSGGHGKAQDGGRATGEAGSSTPGAGRGAGAGRKTAARGTAVGPYPPPRVREPSFVPVPGAPDAGPSPAASGVPAARPAGDEQAEPLYAPARRVLRVLPLGAGLALVGLGIGFLGWRLRRG